MGPVQRMGQLADQPPHRIARQARVCIERQHELHVPRHGAGEKARVGRPAQQPVQLHELAALALPPHPAAFRRVPVPTAVQQQKAVAPLGGMRRVQPRDPGLRLHDQRRIGRGGLGRGVRPVRNQRIMHRSADAREVMHLEPLQMFGQILRPRQQHRHRDERAQSLRHAPRQIEPRQRRGRHAAGDDQIDQRGRSFGRGHQRQKPQRQKHRNGGACSGRCPARAGQHGSRGHRDGAAVTREPDPPDLPEQPTRQRRAVADSGFERGPARADQCVARFALARGSALGGLRQCGLGHLQLARGGSAGQCLDRRAIPVARREVHRSEIRGRAEPRIHPAHLLEEHGPVDLRERAHAGDDVAHRYVRGALPRLRSLHHIFQISALTMQPILEPAQQRGVAGIATAQPLGNLRGQDLGQLTVREPHLPASVHQRVCRQPQVMRLADLHGQPAHVLDQHDPQRDRYRPKLADHQRLDLLIGLHEAAQHGAGNEAVGMGDIGPGQFQYARIAGKGPSASFGNCR